MGAKRMNPRRDRRVFTKTARKTNPRNIPGRVVTRGGTVL